MLAADATSSSVGASLGFTGGPTGAISGSVYAISTTGSCHDFGAAAHLAEVRVQLLDSTGRVLEERLTDGQGEYLFADLLPGQYTVRQQTPTGYLEGAAHAGVGGGVALGVNQVSEIFVSAGQTLVGYDFCDHAESPEPAGSANPPSVPPIAENALPNTTILQLSLQQTPVESREVSTVAEAALPVTRSIRLTEPLILSPRAVFYGGSGQAIKPVSELPDWDEDPLDSWFSTASYWELADADRTGQDALASLLELELYELGMSQHSRDDLDSPFANGDSIQSVEQWPGETSFGPGSLLGEQPAIKVATKVTTEKRPAKVARRTNVPITQTQQQRQETPGEPLLGPAEQQRAELIDQAMTEENPAGSTESLPRQSA